MVDRKSQAEKTDTVTIKKYANRRLYNTATSSYVTLDDLCQMVKDGVEFAVYDAKSGDDITRGVLTQIIVEEETKGSGNLLPITFLRQLIGFYGDNMPKMVLPQYLEMSMRSFAENQEKMREMMGGTFGALPVSLEEVGKQNMAIMERTMRMFSPFPGGESGEAETDIGNGGDTAQAADGNAVEQLQKQLAEMQKQLDAISKK